MGDSNEAESTGIRGINSDHYSSGPTTGPSAQRESVIQTNHSLQYDLNNRNIDTMLTNSTGINSQCKRMARITRITTTTTPRDRGRDIQFASHTSAGNVVNIDIGSTSIANGNVVQVGRGRHRLKQKRSATRADQQSPECARLAAQVVVPVSKSRRENSNSAFDNKAFSSDGDLVIPHELQTQNVGQCLQTNALSVTPSAVNSEHSTDRSTNHCISDTLIDNENQSSNNCIENYNKDKNCFMKTQNDSESTLKGQYCSSGDNRHIIRAQRSTRSTRSAVVKHIGVFYSDLCDVIKAMRTGSSANPNQQNSNNTNTSSTQPTSQTQQQQTYIANQSTQRTNISAPVLLQNEHLIQQSDPVPQQPQPHPYPVQPQPQVITCLQSSPMSAHLMSGQTTVRNACQSQVRSNEPPIHDLPDILNSHLPPPPYSTLPSHGFHLPALSSLAPIRVPPPPPPPPPLPTGRPPLPSRRILHTPSGALAHCSRTTYLRPTCAVSETETSASKTCLSCNGVSIRWFILLIAFIGLLCAIIGTILGALRSTGREHLTLALLMIGVGIILITVSGIAWRLTSSGPTWRSILGLHELHQQQSLCNGSSINEATRRFVPRVPAPYGRTGTHHHPYGAMFYPEFQYRPPPPSYQASMQEYRLRLLLLDRSSSHPHSSTSLSPVSPPPTYRSSAASSLTGTIRATARTSTVPTTGTISAVPTTGTNSAVPMTGTNSAVPITGTISAVPTTGTISAVSSSRSTLATSQTTQSLKPLTQKPSHHSSHHDINRVTILQTTNTSQVCTPNGVNIVAITPTTIMAANAPTTITNLSMSVPIVSSNEVQILAHV